MELADIPQQANEMRKDIIRMITKAGSGHPGGSLSSVDILAALYLGGVLKHDPRDPDSSDRDYFIMSKGHAAPALYTVLAHAGYFLRDELLTLRQQGSRLQGHPDSNLLEGVEVSTGSLGQGLSIACGVAGGLKLDNKRNTVFSLLGDGECEEGQVWEAANFAAHQKLGNLIAIVDCNGLQIDGACCEVCVGGKLDAKFKAFGWNVLKVDGHDIGALVEQLNALKARGGEKPHVVLAETVKGKGVSFMENQVGWHGKAPTEEQMKQALEELSLKGGAHD